MGGLLRPEGYHRPAGTGLAARRAAERGIPCDPHYRGTTGLMAPDVLSGLNVVVVTHSTGFGEVGRQEVPSEVILESGPKGRR